MFVFFTIRSPPEGVWKIDPKVKNGPWGQIWKNHKFDEISFSSIRSPPEGSENSTQRSKMIKKVKYFLNLKKTKILWKFAGFHSTRLRHRLKGVWKINPKDQKLAFRSNLANFWKIINLIKFLKFYKISWNHLWEPKGTLGVPKGVPKGPKWGLGKALGRLWGGFGRLWEALGRLWEAFARLWEALGRLWEVRERAQAQRETTHPYI